jgi:hypothetical protein
MSDNNVLNISQLADLAEETVKDKRKESQENREKAKLILKANSNPGKWHILQEYLIEIQADGKLKEGLGQKYPTYDDQLILLHKKIEVEFEKDPETCEILKNYVTNKTTIFKWGKLPGWADAVIEKMKTYGLFTPEKRAEVIESLRKKAVDDGDVQAAKTWLTMSGDYSDKVDVNDTKFEKYKEYVNALNPFKSVNGNNEE